jgi:glucokinase
MEDYIMTLDVGGTRIKYGAVTAGGKILRSASLPSMSQDGPEKLLGRIQDCIGETTTEMAATPLGVGLGLSGGVDPEHGVILLPGKFKSLEGFPIVPRLRQQYGIPVWADNDGRLAAYAEKHFGAARRQDWVAVFTLGTGVGSGVILDGRILVDPYFMAGTQIGHLIIDKSDDRTCLTGNPGTGEILCSSTALALQVRSAIQRGIPSALTEAYFDNPASIDFHRVTEACRMGDSLCQQELGVWTRNLATMLINAVHCYGATRIILCGGATHAADLYLDTVTELVNARLFRYPSHRQIEIVISDLRDYAGMLGAAAMITERLKH